MAIAARDYIGEDRADIGRMRAAIGVMSASTKLGDYDASALLPNQPERGQRTVEDEYREMLAYSARHAAATERR